GWYPRRRLWNGRSTPRCASREGSARAATAPVALFSVAAAAPEVCTLSLHDALPISVRDQAHAVHPEERRAAHLLVVDALLHLLQDRKSTRLNSSHRTISYAVFCLKKKKKKRTRKRVKHTKPRNSHEKR